MGQYLVFMKFQLKQRVVPGRRNNLFIRIMPLLVVLFIPAMQAVAIDASIELSIGYDDNVTLSPDPTASGFTNYRTEFYQNFLSDSLKTDFKGYFCAEYQDYFKAKNNYQFYAGTLLTFPLLEGRFRPEILYQGMIFRDKEQTEDSLNEHRLEGRFAWLPTARLSMEIQQTFRWHNYRNAEYFQAGRHKSFKGQHCYTKQTSSRYDHISSTGFLFNFYFTPEIDAELLFNHEQQSSTIKKESYHENGVSLSLFRIHRDIWEMSGTVAWRKANYDHTTSAGARRDSTWDIGAGISRLINKYTFFLRIDWEDNNSSLPEESYSNMVTQCGVLQSF